MNAFMSIFGSPPTVVKPWRCNGCLRRFKFKAHATNHRRQTTSLHCKQRGFEKVVPPASQIRNLFDRQVRNQQDEELSMSEPEIENQSVEDIMLIDAEAAIEESYQEELKSEANEEADLEYKEAEAELNNEDSVNGSSSKRGNQHAKPYKISMVIQKVTTLLADDESLSKKQACRMAAEEYHTSVSSVWRWCFT